MHAAGMARAALDPAGFHTVLLTPLRDESGRVIDARIVFADELWRAKLAGGADPTGHSVTRYLGDDGVRLDAIARALEQQVSIRTELRHPRSPDRVAEVQLTPIDGRVLATGREVTDERALLHELEKSQAELLAAQRLATMGSWVWDPRADHAAWSETMLAIYGLPRDGPTPSFAEQRRFYDDETLARTAALLDRVLRTGEPYSMEFDLTRDDGRRRHVIAHGESVLVDGKIAHLRGTVVDITELHETREALLQAERRFATVLDSVRESVAILHPEMDASGELLALRIEWVNPAWRALWGLEQGGVGQDACVLLPPVADLRAIHRELLERGGAHEQTVLQRGGAIVEATFVAMGDRLVVVGRDVTSARRAQEEAQERRRATEIVSLAGGIAHQFNNALMAIVGHTEQLATSATPEAQGDLASILNAAERAATLTRHLLAYAQRQPLQPTAFEVAPFLEQTLPLLQTTAGDGIVVRIEPFTAHHWVLFDRPQLELVLVELVRDARRRLLSEPGQGVVARRSGVEGRITLRVAPSAGFVTLSVADSGSGIASEALTHVFDPFVAGLTFGETTGLGLSSVRGTMQQSGGHVTVESEPGRGTVFTLQVPATDAPAPAADMTDAPQRAPRVLIVDDDALVRRAVSRSVRALGCSALEASSGSDALTVLARTEIDILLTDVTMPEMTGGRLAELAVASRPQLFVIFMSGFGAAALEADGSIPRAAPFLPKPFRASLLRAVLEVANRARRPSA